MMKDCRKSCEYENGSGNKMPEVERRQVCDQTDNKPLKFCPVGEVCQFISEPKPEKPLKECLRMFKVLIHLCNYFHLE